MHNSRVSPLRNKMSDNDSLLDWQEILLRMPRLLDFVHVMQMSNTSAMMSGTREVITTG